MTPDQKNLAEDKTAASGTPPRPSDSSARFFFYAIHIWRIFTLPFRLLMVPFGWLVAVLRKKDQ